jgi:hypothetical protein
MRRTVDQQQESGEEGAVQQDPLCGNSRPATKSGTVAFRSAPAARTARPMTAPATDRNRRIRERASSAAATSSSPIGSLARSLACRWTRAIPKSAGTPTTSPPMTVSTRIFGVWPQSGPDTPPPTSGSAITITAITPASANVAARPDLVWRHTAARSAHSGPAMTAQ